MCETWARAEGTETVSTMQQEDVRPTSVTFVGVLNACASVVVLEEGRFAHEHFIQSGWDSDVFMGNNLVHMYAKVDMIDIQLPSLTFRSRDGILLNTQPNDIFNDHYLHDFCKME
jgi:hypothetical protein